MNYTTGEWKAYCLGSEGYQIRRNNEGIPSPKIREELKERLTPIVERLGGSFEQQRVNANLIAAAPAMYEALQALYNKVTGTSLIMNPVIAEILRTAHAALSKAEGK